MARVSVTKCQGTGNDFVLLDARTPRAPLTYPHLARTLCERRFGVGADGLLVLEPARDPQAVVAMRIFNADGSEAEMCGNGIRCVTRYLHVNDRARTSFCIDTKSGLVRTDITATSDRETVVSVAMGVPAFAGDPPGALPNRLQMHDIHSYGVSVGNPHVVLVTSSDPGEFDLPSLAKEVGDWHVFNGKPNLEVVRVKSELLEMRVHERGVGETWACGTGACAAAVVAIASGRSQTPVMVATKGGNVWVDWQGPGTTAVLRGGAELVFETTVDVPREAVHAP